MIEAELLYMDVMAEDMLWGDGPVMENQWVTVGWAAQAPQGLCLDVCLGLASTPNPLVDNSAAKWSCATGSFDVEMLWDSGLPPSSVPLHMTLTLRAKKCSGFPSDLTFHILYLGIHVVHIQGRGGGRTVVWEDSLVLCSGDDADVSKC